MVKVEPMNISLVSYLQGECLPFVLNIPEGEEKCKSTMEILSVFSAGLQLSHAGKICFRLWKRRCFRPPFPIERSIPSVRQTCI